MRENYVVILLVFSVGSQTVNALVFGTCLNLLAKGTIAGRERCDIWREYWECHLWAINADATFTTEEQIQMQQISSEEAMRSQGVYCSINIKDILTKIRNERRNGVTRTTQRPMGFNEAATIDDCVNAIGTAIGIHQQMTCDILMSSVKCALRVTGQYYQPTEQVYQVWDDYIQREMTLYGIRCVSVSARRLSEEVARENGYTTARALTTFTAVSSFDSRFDSAKTTTDCKTLKSKLEQEVGRGSCSVWRSTLKCYIRVSDFYKSSDPNTYSGLQISVDPLEKHCPVDTDALIQEVRREHGFNSGTKLGINVVIFLTLAVSVIISLFLDAC